jgi:hypothetical protein
MAESPRIDDEERALTELEVAALLRKLCTDLGFCFSADVAEQFESSSPRTIEAFTRAVFDAEKLDPALADRKLYGQVYRVVSTAFKGITQNGV